MKITACPICGSTHIDIGGVRDGVHPQEYNKKTCKNCGWTGFPLEFETDKEYRRFLIELNKPKNPYTEQQEPFNDDPAAAAPIQRHVYRSTWTFLLIGLAITIPALVFLLITVGAQFSYLIGFSFALTALFSYFYVVWKKELWTHIKR